MIDPESGVLFTNGTGSNSECNILVQKREPIFIAVCLYSEIQTLLTESPRIIPKRQLKKNRKIPRVCVCVWGGGGGWDYSDIFIYNGR